MILMYLLHYWSIQNSLEREARALLGTPYVYGAESEKGVDCSGLIYLVHRNAGVPIHRISARRMVETFPEAKTPHLMDIPAFSHDGASIAHVGLLTVARDDMLCMIHASSSRGVIESEITPFYWGPRLKVIVRSPVFYGGIGRITVDQRQRM